MAKAGPLIFTEYEDENPTKTGESLEDDKPRRALRYERQK
jgi:hypothetical protein